MPEQPPTFENATESKPLSEKERIWAEKMKRVNEVVDGAGEGIDEEIKEPVVAFNVMGLNTYQSCGGHPEKGKGAPRVWIEGREEPDNRFMNQKKILQDAVDKLGISVEQLKTDKKYLQDWIDTDKKMEASRETEEWKAWKAENERLHKMADEFLEEFYKNRKVEEPMRLVVSPEGGFGAFRVHNGGEDFSRNDELNEEQKKGLETRLIKYREEMDAFGKFLKDKFFNE